MIPAVEELLTFARGLLASSPNPFAEPVFARLYASAAAATREEQSAIVADLASGLGLADPVQAACVALTCGTLVEQGAAPTAAGGPIVQRFAAAARATPDAQQALRWLGLASMACLCRSATVRGEAQRIAGLSE